MSAPSQVSHPVRAPEPIPAPAGVIARLIAVVGEKNVIREAVQLRTYECDALTSFRASPSVVVLPASTEEVTAVVRIAVEAGMPIVPRGAGTGLSGGALPVPGCMLLGLSRMKRILEVDLDDGWIRVQPGVINLDVSKEISGAGYYYAPDPSSQSVCTIGGNVAENSGGAHCLKYGFTVHHVLGVEAVLPDGERVHFGGAVLDSIGLDLLGVLVGSEGTLAVVTKATVRLLRRPEKV
ncbi:MAG TPA: FAD-binding protein, partial [Myxococcaceae bacterium]|nr:FAD-binding protein [Myxococcaceae bacterium]